MSRIGIVQPEPTDLAGEELAAVEKLQKGYHDLKSELGKVIVGQEAVIEELLIALFCRGHALLVGENTFDFNPLQNPWIEFQPNPIHTRFNAQRHHRHGSDRGRQDHRRPCDAVCARADFFQRDSGR